MNHHPTRGVYFPHVDPARPESQIETAALILDEPGSFLQGSGQGANLVPAEGAQRLKRRPRGQTSSVAFHQRDPPNESSHQKGGAADTGD
jgi:hypothetical protein